LKNLSNDDITKLEEVGNTELEVIFNWLIILKKENEIEKIKEKSKDGKQKLG